MTVLTIKYFASVRELVGCGQESLPFSVEVNTVAKLRAHLQARTGTWQTAFGQAHLRCAVNQVHCRFTQALQAGDEVAFFPPLTGG